MYKRLLFSIPLAFLAQAPAHAADAPTKGGPQAVTQERSAPASVQTESALECPPGATDPLCATENAPGQVLTDQGKLVDAEGNEESAASDAGPPNPPGDEHAPR